MLSFSYCGKEFDIYKKDISFRRLRCYCRLDSVFHWHPPQHKKYLIYRRKCKRIRQSFVYCVKLNDTRDFRLSSVHAGRLIYGQKIDKSVGYECKCESEIKKLCEEPGILKMHQILCALGAFYVFTWAFHLSPITEQISFSFYYEKFCHLLNC